MLSMHLSWKRAECHGEVADKKFNRLNTAQMAKPIHVVHPNLIDALGEPVIATSNQFWYCGCMCVRVLLFPTGD